jgi:hypothetical protein
MEFRYWFRFTLGQVMVLIAVSAFFLAAAIFSSRGQYFNLALLHAIVGCVGLGVFLYNRRLSKWMWAVIVGYVGPTPLDFTVQLFTNLTSQNSYNLYLIINTIEHTLFSIIFVAGIAMTFRDIRERFANAESERESVSVQSSPWS